MVFLISIFQVVLNRSNYSTNVAMFLGSRQMKGLLPLEFISFPQSLSLPGSHTEPLMCRDCAISGDRESLLHPLLLSSTLYN